MNLVMNKIEKPIIEVLNGRKPPKVPFWLMRQAGRYLPEYRDLRAKAGGFLDLVYNPEMAAEITVQPLRRFGMDAAILFSDILIVPHALGQHLEFRAGEGPHLSAIESEADLAKLDLKNIDQHCAPIYETVFRTREKLTEEGFNQATLIGFCGSPWTVACYMVEGGSSRDFEKVRHWALQKPDSFQKLIDLLVEASVRYLTGQIEAGAEALQLFDSWSGLLDEDQFRRWVVAPTKKITTHFKKHYPYIRIIGFPRGAGVLTLPYAGESGVDALSLDPTIPTAWAAQNLQPLLPLQGNLDPLRLLTGGVVLEDAVQKILYDFKEGPFIFNLGHGVIKETEIENVQSLTTLLRKT